MVVAVGSAGSGPVAEAVRDYEERASRYFDLETVEVPAGGGGEPAEVRRQEGDRLFDRVPEELHWFALTRKGRGMRSRRLARYLEELATYGRAGAAFLVGGAHGLDERVLERARYRLSLSPMTLPHALARLVLTEQVYRAGTIARGEPYHKER
ncbi:MAG: 23S rRNA (pseudouridine(1915)-N(3))-methyltransferase RlmH [Candidatus Palauibacterales bacterium]|nr:23S rRNA (pseudouridine(1915)-N(3))-methyltransferase RlmH [Candidatus Palauibacterales bacterium]